MAINIMFVLLRGRLARPSMLRLVSTSRRFQPSRLDEIECVEDYRPGGFHPVNIGTVFAQGRYRIVHKLGFGGSSTIWLARNQLGELVTLKVMRADVSSNPLDEIPELSVPRKLSEYVQARHAKTHLNFKFQTVEDHFIEHGPNGSHLCLVYNLAGPSILSMSDSPGRVAGSRRLRCDFSRKLAKQVVDAVELMHAAGFVHGDITTSNILLRIAEDVQNWSDNSVYVILGQPETEEVVSLDNSPLGPHVPTELVAPINNEYLTYSSFIEEDILLIDFGQSFSTFQLPTNYEPATVPHYQSPEARFDGRIGMPSDVWALACMIFEIRAGFSLFGNVPGGEIFKEIVATLGKLPEPWWGAFGNRHHWFDDEGKPKAEELHQGPLKTSIRQKLASIGVQDQPPVTGTDGSMMEPPGTRLDEIEIQLLGDLLEKMLHYQPQDRIKISEVVSHPWFALW